MNEKTIKEIVSFLKKNGFKLVEKNGYSNDKCNVYIGLRTLMISYKSGKSCYEYFGDNLFWMIGFLTSFGFIDKNYKL